MKSLRRSAAAVALASLALAGCSTPSAGTAASVGGTTISDSQLASSVDELRTQVVALKDATWSDGKGTAKILRDNVYYLLLDEAARREGISVSQGQIDKLIDDAVKSNANGDRATFVSSLAASGTPESQISAAARAVLIERALNDKLAPGETDSVKVDKARNDYLGALADEIGVDISPRFGTWDAAHAGLGDPPNDLSALQANASASPQPSAS